MPEVTIRQLHGDELLDIWVPMSDYAFGETPPFRDREEMKKGLPYQKDKHILALFEDDQPVSTATSIHMTQSLRGKVFRMGGVASVSTHPAARRKGYVRRLMRQLFENMHAEGETLSSLLPFRESFYGRMGYVGFPEMRVMEFSPLNLSPLVRQTLPGTVERMDIKEGFAPYQGFLKQIQPQIHGMALHPDSAAAGLRDFGKVWLAIARDPDGEVVGVMTYRLTGFAREMKVERLFHRNGLGKHLLLQWIGRHADQVTTVWMKGGPDSLLETWAFDLQIKLHVQRATDLVPTPMGRIAIVEAMDGMHTGPGRFTARIHDAYCPWNNKAYTFETVDGLLTVTPTDQAATELSIQALAALAYIGADPGDFAYRGWGEPDQDMQAAMRQMFPPALPFLHQGF